nr:hypothetical protein [uncultured Undibacterium sp.]
MNLDSVSKILSVNDGSLPDIEFDFGEEKRSSMAYDLIQQQASCLSSQGAYYWSKSKEIEVPIKFGENPAELVLSGEAEPFHVVFGGMRSNSGAIIPDLGLFILGSTQISLDYRMGKDWNRAAIEGLFELMLTLKCLAPNTKIRHVGNVFDENDILLSAFEMWQTAHRIIEGNSK